MNWPRKSPKIMGIVNVTPDSFSDGGQFQDADAAITHGLRLLEDGADILDIGGESTRPGADLVPEQQELDRIMPVVEGLIAKSDVAISIDTRKPGVARAAIMAGSTIWNDVSALTYSADSIDVAASVECQIILMHAQGDPKTMQVAPRYSNVGEDVFDFLESRMTACNGAGIKKNRIIIDPGIGFGKSLEHNLALLKTLKRFADLAPVLLGASRKRFIAALDRNGRALDRLGGSLAAAIWGAQCGVEIVRVHDVAQTKQALAVAQAIEVFENKE